MSGQCGWCDGMKKGLSRLNPFGSSGSLKRVLGSLNEQRIGLLFQFGFFVHHVFAGNRVEFFDFEFAGHGTLVFGCGVEVACAGRRFQFDFVAHDVFL